MSDHSSPKTAAARQRRYRASKSLASIDLTAPTMAKLHSLRERTGLTNDQAVRRALELLQASLKPGGGQGKENHQSVGTQLKLGLSD